MNNDHLRLYYPKKLQVGGTINPRRSVYIGRRDVEEHLYQSLFASNPCNIFSSRQTGKSSLVVNVAHRLHQAGRRTVFVDLAGEFGQGEEQDSNNWYLALLRIIARTLRPGFNAAAWWKDQDAEVPSQVFLSAIRKELFVEDRTPAAIFLDEIDATFRLPFSSDLFQILRTLYNERFRVPEFELLTFSLVGVATMDELIKDQRTTSYNIGTPIVPRDFDPRQDDLTPILEILSAAGLQAQNLLDRVFYWTSGHPFLTINICQQILDRHLTSPDAVSEMVETEMLNSVRALRDVHFQTIEGYFGERVRDRYGAYNLYERLLSGHRVIDRQTLLSTQLKLSGLVRQDDRGCLKVRNLIYERIFDFGWIRQNRPSWFDAFRKPLYQSIAIITFTLAFLLPLIYQRGVVEPGRNAARTLTKQLGTTTNPAEAKKLYLQLLGETPLEQDFLLVKRLVGYEETAHDEWRKFWSKRLEDYVVASFDVILSTTQSYEDATLAYDNLATQKVSESMLDTPELSGMPIDLFERDTLVATLSRKLFQRRWKDAVDRRQKLAYRDLMFILEQTEDKELARRIRDVLVRNDPLEIIANANSQSQTGDIDANAIFRTKEERWQGRVLMRAIQNGSDEQMAEYAHAVLSGAIHDEVLGRAIRGLENEAADAFRSFREKQDTERINEWLFQIDATCDPDSIQELGRKIQGKLVDEKRLQRTVASTAENRRLGEEKIHQAQKRCEAEKLIYRLTYGVDDLASAEEIQADLIGKIADSRGVYWDITTERVKEAVDAFEKRMERQAFDIHNEQLTHRDGESELLAVKAYTVMSGQEPYLRGEDSLFIKGQAQPARTALRSYFQQRADALWEAAERANTQGRTDQAFVLAAAATLRHSHPIGEPEWISESGSRYPYLYRTLRLRDDAKLNTLALSVDGSWGASNDSPGHSVIIWDLEKGTRCQSLDHHADQVTTLDILNEGDFATGSADKTVRLWTLTSPSRPCSSEVTSKALLSDIRGILKDLTFSFDGHFLAAISGDDQLTLWAEIPDQVDFAQMRCPRGRCSLKTPSNPSNLWITNSSKPVVVVTASGGLASYSLQDGKRRRLPAASHIAFSHDGNQRALLHEDRIEVQRKRGQRFKAAEGSALDRPEGEVIDLQFVPGDRYLSLATKSSIVFWDSTGSSQNPESAANLDLRPILGCPLDEEDRRPGDLTDCSASLQSIRWYGPTDDHDGPTLVTLHGDASARIWRLPKDLNDLSSHTLPPLSDWNTWKRKLGLTVDDAGEPVVLSEAGSELDDLEACIRHTRDQDVPCVLRNSAETIAAKTFKSL